MLLLNCFFELVYSSTTAGYTLAHILLLNDFYLKNDLVITIKTAIDYIYLYFFFQSNAIVHDNI